MRYCLSLTILFILLSVVFFSCGKNSSQESAAQLAPLAVADSLDDLIAPGDTLVKITPSINFFSLADGVLWDNGNLFFNNFVNSETARTYRMDSNWGFKIIRNNNGSTAAIVKCPKGNYYVAEVNGHRIVEMNRDGEVLRVVVRQYNGKRLDNPNDLVFDTKGGFYFSDSRFRGPDFSQDKPAIYYVKSDSTIIRVADDLSFPNGLALTPDGSVLYATNTSGGDKGQYVYAYDVSTDGTFANRRIFATLELTQKNIDDPAGSGGADGCAIDVNGNLYVSTLQSLGVQVFNSQGKHLGNISTNGLRSNTCTFGGTDMKTLYVAAQNGVRKISVKVPGLKLPIGSK